MNDMQSYEPGQTPFVSGGGKSKATFKKKPALIIAAAIVLLIIVMVSVMALKKDNAAPAGAQVDISSSVANVSIDATGYLPKTIKVKKGQEITWTNKHDAVHRLTADQTVLPGFDTAELLEPGDSYTYIFDKAGTYHYYDPSDPKAYVGTVTVE
jgi:plastocyanin